MLFELLCHKRPWEGKNTIDICAEVCKGNRPGVEPEAASQAPGPFVDLMYRCWAQDASQRPDFSHIAAQLWELCEAWGVYGESKTCDFDHHNPPGAKHVVTENDGEQWVELLSSLLHPVAQCEDLILGK